MIESVNPIALQGAVPIEAPQPAPREVSLEDIDRFEAAMTGDGVRMDPVEIAVQEPVLPAHDFGQVLMDTVGQLREDQMSNAGRIEEMTTLSPDGKPMEIRDLFNLQFELMQFTFQQDLTAKVADKLSVGVQTLFQNQ